MNRHSAVWALLLLGAATVLADTGADDEARSKTVIGPRNVDLHNGANALKAGDAERGVTLTLRGLKFAHGQKEEQTGHANLCAGFVMLRQAKTALPHCDWVLERYPDHWRTYNNRALVYLSLERFEESAADIEKGQALRPSSEKLKEVKGMYLDEVEPVTENIVIDDRRKPPTEAPEE